MNENQTRARLTASVEVSKSDETIVNFGGFDSRCGEELALDRINQKDFYSLGGAIHRLSREYGIPKNPFSAAFIINDAAQALELLLSYDPPRIILAKQTASALLARLKGLSSTYFRDENGEFSLPRGDDSPIPEYMWSIIDNELREFESVFFAELSAASVYSAPQRAGYHVPTLIDDGHLMLPQDLHPYMGERAIGDYRSATRCFAFSLPTAAGYHAARAMEAVLETYFQTFMNRPGATKNGWNDYLDELRKLHTKAPAPKHLPDNRTLIAIDQVRGFHRNPLMHPRVVLSDTDADMILSIAKAAMVKMAEEIQIVWGEKKSYSKRIINKEKAKRRKPKTASRA